MGRVATTLGIFATLLAAAACALVATIGAEALDAGRGLYVHRSVLASQLDRARDADVVWLGDSTIISVDARRPYPDLLAERMLGPRGTRSAGVGVPGLDVLAP